MSGEAPSKTKSKKTERKGGSGSGGRKRKHEDTVDLPGGGDEEEEGGGVALEAAVPEEKAASKKKRKRDDAPAAESAEAAQPAEKKQKPSTLSRNLRKRRKEKEAKGLPTTTPTSTSATATSEQPTDDQPADDQPSKLGSTKGAKFILFIGNLPYSTTDASLTAHFKKLQPFILRHRTDPTTGKSKGFAFLEFEQFDRMETCIKKYHHSIFDPADYKGDRAKLAEPGMAASGAVNSNTLGLGPKAKKSRARQINVELTAGGGGKSESRTSKIRDKNITLEEERVKRAEAELKAESVGRRGGASDKPVEEKTKGRGRESWEKREAAKKKTEEGKGTTGTKVVESASTEGVHPSRLAMMVK
ncbi:hypothetical protein LTR56_012027 [Elasticomyces elasticus]|nr:hypothetical protein LTR22_023652 [Elasticomyces elasticus]KAK3640231.1 hypothetical protein LTR56_012027 [Elasticomyces elasticus]KAK4907839.1 hypothetical protein LTR49_023176 [Elasticomyces elasticus]KAK5751334.1 hypothetical protein LTS12_018572 [Elasticomyces elasticus]